MFICEYEHVSVCICENVYRYDYVGGDKLVFMYVCEGNCVSLSDYVCVCPYVPYVNV